MAEEGNSGKLGQLRWRLVFAILGSMGMAIVYGLKVNLSVAIVAMVDHAGLARLASAGNNDDSTVLVAGNGTVEEECVYEELNGTIGDSKNSSSGGNEVNE